MSIFEIIKLCALFFVIGAASGLIGMHMYRRKDLKAKKKQLEDLNITIDKSNEDFKKIGADLRTNGKIILKQEEKLKQLKQKAEAVKDESKPDKIDDLINFF